MRILLNEEIPVSIWKDFINLNPYGSPFQTAEYFNFYNSVPGQSAIAIAIFKNDQITALSVVTLQKECGIKSYFSKRAIIYGGPLVVDDGNGTSLNILLSEINKIIKGKAIYAETRNFFNYERYIPLFKNAGWLYQPYLNYQLYFNNSEDIWNKFNTNRKRQIKKALKCGVISREAQSKEEVEAYYFVLKNLYKKRIRKPLPGKKFFIELFNRQLAKIFLIHYKNRIIGGIVCPVFSKKAIYEFYVCGLDQEYKEASPSVMATYAAIEYACLNGINYFDFMGAGKPDDNYGVRDFKSKFGGNIVEFGRFIKILEPNLYNLGSAVMKAKARIKK